MPDPADRRAAERFAVNVDTSCTFISPVVENFGPAKLTSLSMAGIGFFMGSRVEKDALVAITLENRGKGFSKTVVVRVAHATHQLGGWLVGGTFVTPLTYQELTILVM